MYARDQPASRVFNLSYRTQLAMIYLEGFDHGYKIHILYNVMAAPDDVDFETLGESVAVKPFSWVLNGTPAQPPGTNPIRPTSHMSLNSTSIDPLSLAATRSDSLRYRRQKRKLSELGRSVADVWLMIKVATRGSFRNTEAFLQRMKTRNI
jgi:hypothetical protein